MAQQKAEAAGGGVPRVALLLAVCMLCTLGGARRPAQEWSTPGNGGPGGRNARRRNAGPDRDPRAPSVEPAPDPAPEDGGEADPAPATAETAQEDEPEQPEQPEQDTPAGPATAETAQGSR